MKRTVCFLCTIFVSCMFVFCACDSTNSPNQSDTSSVVDEYPSVKKKYSVNDFDKDAFKCSIAYSIDKFEKETVVEGKQAVDIYNAMNMDKWIAIEGESYDSSTKIILLSFYVNNLYYLVNTYGSIYISDADLVFYTKGPRDTAFKVFKAPKGTYSKIIEQVGKDVN